MAKLKVMLEREDGWSDDVFPHPGGYKMACCDCGLVHDIEFSVVKVVKHNPNGTFRVRDVDSKTYRVRFRARRNKRSTGQVRRHKNNRAG